MRDAIAQGSTQCTAAAGSGSASNVYRPFFTNCIHSPLLQSLGSTRRCDQLQRNTRSDVMKQPSKTWAKAKSITVDVSRCSRYLPQSRSLRGLKRPELPPLTMELRPRSSDHIVFLQVSLPRQ